MKKAIIILPTYNEEKNIEKTIKTIYEKNFFDTEINILVVDSASTDNTVKKVTELQKKYKTLFLTQQNQKEGLASAYIEGIKWGMKQEEEYNIFIQMDADLQHPIETLPEMISATEKYDLVIGSRYVKGGGWDKEGNNFIKRSISFLGSFYSRTVLNCPIKDLTGGYNVWRKETLSHIDFDKIHSKGYMFQIEMKYKTFKNNMKILEYPIMFFARKEGKSKMDLKIIFEALIWIWKLKKV